MEAAEFEAIKSIAAAKSSEDDKWLSAPYWRKDQTAVPEVCRLQPVSTLPGCEANLPSEADSERGKLDETFKRR